MFIHIKLLNGWQELLWYKVPPTWQQILPGTIVQVPLRNRIVPAIIVSRQEKLPSNITFTIKDVHGIEPFPHDPSYIPFIKKLSSYYQVDDLYFIKRLRSFLQQKEAKEQKEKEESYEKKIVGLTQEQEVVCDFLSPRITQPTYMPVVLHGVTGSGKTEVYKQLIMQAITKNKTVILLLPEITLAFAFERRLKQELPGIAIFGFHSGASKKEKNNLWQQLIAHKPILIIGVHLPILLPIFNLGLIIIDEEHAVNYQEKKHPKINSKEAALLRAKLYALPILLGSATPSFSTLYNVKTKKWYFFQLKKRFSGAFPQIKTVLLTDKKGRKNFWISKELE
ncbi:MAG: DEAD/DEAH box helicase, partial [Candidatus Babeliales bacterium]